MKTAVLKHVFENTTPAAVFAAIADLRRFGDAHPFMKTVSVTATPGEHITDYHITETAQLFGFIPMPVQYDARVTIIQTGTEVHYDSQVQRGVVLHICWKVETNEAGSVELNEQIEVKANAIIAAVFMRMLRKAHLETIAELKTKLV
jgi:hypothetical protein